MASKILTDAVARGEGGGYDFVCPVTDGTCGDPASGETFRSTGWPTKAAALARAEEHAAEHKGEGAMSTLDDFRAKHGVGVDGDGKAVVSAKDL